MLRLQRFGISLLMFAIATMIACTAESTPTLSFTPAIVAPTLTSSPTKPPPPTHFPTATAKPTLTSTPKPTATPQPTLTSDQVMLDEFARRCSRAFDLPISSGSPKAPVIGLVNQKHIWKQSYSWGLWGNESEFQLRFPFFGTSIPTEAQTLVCIQEERVDAGTYTNGQPYQLVNWSVRLVQGSEPIVIADTQLEGSNVPYAITTFGGDCSTPNAACTPIVGIPPSAELNKWLLTLFGDATFLIPEAGIITGAVYAPAGQTVISSMMEETELFRPPEQTGRMDFQNFLIYWDPKTGKATRTVDLGIINGQTVFSPDGKTLVSYELGKIRSWDATTGRLLHTATTTVEFIESKIRALSPDGKILATTDYLGGDIDLWNTTTGEMLFSLESDNLTEGRPIAFSPDGLILAAGGNDPRSPGWDPEIRLWDVMRGNILLTLKPNGAQVDSVAFSPDGKILASGVSDGTIKLWDVASGRELISFSGSNDPINDIEFSPSGKTFASGSDEGTVKLWDIEEGALLLTFNASFVDSIFFAPDGRTLVTTHVGLMKLWNVGAR